MTHMAAERVVMTHPETGHVCSVTREAFERAWSKNGWELVDDADQVRKDELTELADEQGVDPSGTKTEILDRLEKET